MSAATSPVRRPPVNPFATRFTRPGALPPLGPDGRPRDLRGLLAALAGAGGRGAIEGPHGTGKSTLLAALAAALPGQGQLPVSLRVRSPRDLPAVLAAVAAAAPRTTVLVDGWERLGRPGALLARLLARARRCGLVVTSHAPAGLPVLVRCGSAPGLLAAIVARLPDHGGTITTADVDEAFHCHAGNLRDALFDLYDRFERRVR